MPKFCLSFADGQNPSILELLQSKYVPELLQHSSGVSSVNPSSNGFWVTVSQSKFAIYRIYGYEEKFWWVDINENFRVSFCQVVFW